MNDYTNKKIPNKCLLYLLGLLPIFLFFLPLVLNQGVELFFLAQFFISFVITFLLYFFGIWGAGDAKYLLVLSLFLPHIGILTFIGNIALLTLGYLLIFFIGFYLKKIFFDITKGTNFSKSVLHDLKEKFYYNFTVHKSIYNKSMFQLLGSWVLKFLIIFTSLRLLKIYIFDKYIITSYYNYFNNDVFVSNILNNTMLLFLLIGVSVLLFYYILQKIYSYISQRLLHFVHHYLLPKCNINQKYSKDILVLFLLILFIIPLAIEFHKNSQELLGSLYLIGSYYLLFFIVFKVFYYLYKISFQIGEEEVINISNLKIGDIIDKSFLVKKFENENCLGANNNTKGLMYPSPRKFINGLSNPVDKHTISIIKKSYKILNKTHENSINVQPLSTIKTLKTFAFSGYIFGGFIISYLYQDTIFKNILSTIIQILKNLYN